MAVHYHCRHCKTHVGTLDHQGLSTEQLGFHELNQEERKEMVSYTENGDIYVKTICEDCQETLARNPDYHSLTSFIQ